MSVKNLFERADSRLRELTPSNPPTRLELQRAFAGREELIALRNELTSARVGCETAGTLTICNELVERVCRMLCKVDNEVKQKLVDTCPDENLRQQLSTLLERNCGHMEEVRQAESLVKQDAEYLHGQERLLTVAKSNFKTYPQTEPEYRKQERITTFARNRLAESRQRSASLQEECGRIESAKQALMAQMRAA